MNLLDQWKSVYYPISAEFETKSVMEKYKHLRTDSQEYYLRVCIELTESAILKWSGLSALDSFTDQGRLEVDGRGDLTFYAGADAFRQTDWLSVNSYTCTLCHYNDNTHNGYTSDDDHECVKCPIYKENGYGCDNAYSDFYSGGDKTGQAMLELLNKTLSSLNNRLCVASNSDTADANLIKTVSI